MLVGDKLSGISSACFNLVTQVRFGKMTEKYRQGIFLLFKNLFKRTLLIYGS